MDARPQDGNSLDTDLLSRDDASNLADEERGFSGNTQSSHISTNGNSSSSTHIDETELQSRRGSIASDSSHFVKRKTSQLIDVIRGNQHKGNRPLSPQLASLVDGYAASDIAAGIRSEIASLSNRNPEEELPDVAEENRLLRGRRGASWLMQFRILSGRAFKNLYRDPALLMAHYLSSIILAREISARLSSICFIQSLTIRNFASSNLWILLPQRQVRFPFSNWIMWMTL